MPKSSHNPLEVALLHLLRFEHDFNLSINTILVQSSAMRGRS